ncbi:CynX/NimT family MFS transporter OS=Streptomyces fumanus OX=67302 GN=GCM10018772_64310 PE=4 SV=1 [Streptomyces fumanus]
MGLMPSEETRTLTSTTVTDPAAQDTAEADAYPTRAWRRRLLVVAIVLAALNLRPAITSLGALLEEVRDGLGMSGSMAGLLTSVPPLCFAGLRHRRPRLARAGSAPGRWCAPGWPPSRPGC